MADFLQFCRQFSTLDEEATEEMLRHAQRKVFKKGDILLHQGETCRYLFFINEGLAKTSSYREDKEFIMRFFAENVLFSVFDSFITQTPSNFMVIALERTTVTVIGHREMEILCNKYHSVETFFRKLVSLATVKMTRRINEMLEQNATERYNRFVEENNSILQRIKLGDLARYLGITQQSLSRIRTAK